LRRPFSYLTDYLFLVILLRERLLRQDSLRNGEYLIAIMVMLLMGILMGILIRA